MNVECEYLTEFICKIASDLAGIEATTSYKACKVCTEKDEEPKTENLVTLSLACKALREVGNKKKATKLFIRHHEIEVKRNRVVDLGEGVGTELLLLFKDRKIEFPPDCACRGYVYQMNYKGLDWCIERWDKVLEYWDFELRRQNKGLLELLGDWSINDLLTIAVQRTKRKQKWVAEIPAEDVVAVGSNGQIYNVNRP